MPTAPQEDAHVADSRVSSSNRLISMVFFGIIGVIVLIVIIYFLFGGGFGHPIYH